MEAETGRVGRVVVASDAALVAAALADPAAFDAIYERYHAQVFRFVLARGLDEDAAVDVVATTFERGLAHLRSYRADGGGLPAWLFRIARNALIDERRRQGRLTDLGAASAYVSDHGTLRDPDLQVALGRLSEEAREAIALRYAGGLTAAEIGSVLGKRPAAVQKLIERTLEHLKEALG
ncbi:MAG: RNA polymerase sigma factor [Chloroflexota bacterium]